MTEKKELDKCDNCRKYQEQAFELEVDEDLQQERLNRFWKRYHWWIYTAIFIILATTAGLQIYQSWRMKIRLKESDLFENAVIQIFNQKPEEARPVLRDLATTGRTGYRHLARLELAGLAARQNDMETALAELSTMIDSDAPQNLKNIAILSYVGYQVDTGDVQDLLKMLQPLLQSPEYVTPAAELTIALYIREGQSQQAKTIIQEALKMPNLSEQTIERLKTIAQLIED